MLSLHYDVEYILGYILTYFAQLSKLIENYDVSICIQHLEGCSTFDSLNQS